MRRALENWTRDFRLAGRTLLRAPGFTVIAGATLALAIGANTAIFGSAIDRGHGPSGRTLTGGA